MPNRGAHSGSETSGARSQGQTSQRGYAAMDDKARRDKVGKDVENAQSTDDKTRGQRSPDDRTDRRS